MKRFLLLTLLLLLPLWLMADITLSLSLPQWNGSHNNLDPALSLLLNPGNPALPYYPVRVLIPMGQRVEQVSVSLTGDTTTRNNVELDLVRQPQPVSQPTADLTVKNPAVWTVNAPYPQADFTFLGTQFWKGYQLALLNLYPWHYNPVTRSLTAASAVQIQIQTTADARLSEDQNRMLIINPSVTDILRKTAVTHSTLATYSKTPPGLPTPRIINLNTPYQCIIITSQSRIGWFTNYIQWKNAHNVPTGVFAIEDVLTEYDGLDNPDRLRSFIIAAYTAWSATATPLEYVILGGDDEVIPIRGAYGHVGDTVDQWMPCDLYYGCLDGTWNNDGDDLWGEHPIDQVDFLPEVLIGRFPAETQAEFQHQLDKTIAYVDNPTFSNNIANFYGENLNWNPVTWGGDYKDDVALHLPAAYDLHRYYQRDGTYSADIVWNTINNGAAIMNHMGHANQTYLMGQSNASVENLQNTEYGFLYSQGCYPAAFDQRTSGDGECIGEHFVTTTGGLYAFIGNTRYGWYMPGDVNGPSEYFDRQFFIGLFEQNLPQLGKAHQYSLMQNVNAAMQNDVMRWCYYETIIFGDPSVAVKPYNPTLPCLALESYRYDDSEGDNDGNLNPSELIRLYPRVRNLAGWNTAHNVTVSLEGLPNGISAVLPQINAAQLSAGACLDTLSYISFQIPAEISFGQYHFTIRLTCHDQTTGALVCDRRYQADFEITLLDSHFPWDCYHSGKSAPVVYDFNGDTHPDVFYADVTGDGYFINHLGQTFASHDLSATENINRSFAMDDIDNDGDQDMVFASRTGNVWAVSAAGDSLWTFSSGSMTLYTPVLADLDQQPGLETVFTTLNRNLYALDNTGNLLSGFPVLLTGGFNSEIAIANLDADPYPEIIAGTSDGKLWAIRHDGSVQTGFPVQLTGSVNGAPLVLDNGNIVAGTPNHLYVVSPQGVILTTKALDGDLAVGAIPVDLNRDGILDIVCVTSSGRVYACRQDGTDLPGFPVWLNVYVTCPPLAADVDGDEQYELIVQTYQNTIYILNHDGSELPGFPFTQSYNSATPATLTDFDQDGNYELVTGYANGVLVIKLRRPLGQMDAWTVYRGTLNRQNSFASVGFVPIADESTPVATILYGNYPNPFSASTTFRYALKEPAPVKLDIYNIKGQRVRSLVSETKTAGTHQTVWNGRDDIGNPVSSGIYLYRLQAGVFTQTRKLLLK